jgi:hypothetical protein
MYLTPDDLVPYSLPLSTTAGQIRIASGIVDSYLSRPEGLLWMADYNGMPCCMTALRPTLSFTLQSDIAPADTVAVALPSTVNFANNLGEAIVIDQDVPGKIEVAYITAAAPGTMTLRGVTTTHSAGATLRLGLTLKEERALPSGRNITQTMKGPLRRLISAFGRYDYGRRNEQNSGWFQEITLLTSISAFGGPPVWEEINLLYASTSDVTDEIWFPAGILLAYFNTVRYSYVVGHPSAASLPRCVKSAVAAIIRQASLFPELTGNVKMMKAGDTAVERFRDSSLDADTRLQLDALKARMWA